jgi:hypothetical protein
METYSEHETDAKDPRQLNLITYVEAVMRGGDTDTNAAICGALLGAVYGLDAIPAQWVDRVLNCSPQAGHPGVNRPRPECFWPVDALELADRLIQN